MWFKGHENKVLKKGANYRKKKKKDSTALRPKLKCRNKEKIKNEKELKINDLNVNRLKKKEFPVNQTKSVC